MVIQQHGEFVYVGDAERVGESFILGQDEAHHLNRVRRKRVGQEVYASDGRGLVYRSIIETPDTITVVETLEHFGEPRLHLTLICGCLQGEKSRDVVDTAVQLGVREIVWVRMERSQEVYGESRLRRLERIAIQSLKQSGRAFLPVQGTFNGLSEALANLPTTQVFAAHPGITNAGGESGGALTRAALVVGPEGGFSEHELLCLQNARARFIELGPCRLRTEVAVAAGLALLLTLAGEFNL